ncbi:MAG: ribose-phosphate pyrophosphokinase [Candidatus Aureabacteria bacterium]|nr:ribose-phosphate pyrophosphokinase [Candidatus Auribacterota bacterium]
MIDHTLMLFTGNANPELARKIAACIGLELSGAKVGRFPEGEVAIRIDKPVRGSDVFLIQGTSPPPNENMMELLAMIDALHRASAARITAVLPYYGYGRQDRKDRPRVPITARLVADLITAAGADRVLTVDLHAAQIQGFFDIPVDHLYAAPVLISYLLKKLPRRFLKNLVVVSPDVGGIKIADHFAKHMNVPLAIVDKRRIHDTKTEVHNLIGEVKGREVLIVDDLVSTGTSLVSAIAILKDKGAGEIQAAITHPILCGEAVSLVEACPLTTLWVTDTVPLSAAAARSPKIKVISVAGLLGEAIKRIHDNTPVSILFGHQE